MQDRAGLALGAVLGPNAIRLAPANAESNKLVERVRDWGTFEWLPGATYRNLEPADTPVGTRSAGELVKVDGAWKIKSGSTFRTPKGLYNFVTRDGRTFAGPNMERMDGRLAPNTHVSLALGRNVEYAGMIRFSKSGEMRYWNNSSGHYEPHAFANFKAGLPLQLFQADPNSK